MAQTGHALRATILADTNRDGKVDVEGDTDVDGKQTWTNESGALFLANIGDTDRRCSQDITDETPDKALGQCHDASGTAQRNPKYLAPIRTVPNTDLSSDASGYIYITDEVAAEKARIFLREGDDWTYVDSNHTFTAQKLKDGLELGIDSRDVRRPDWNGKATVHFRITDGDEEVEDFVALRVAPILTHHHGQAAERVFTTTGEGKADYSRQLVTDFKNHTAQAGIEKEVYVFDDFDVWSQDFFEPSYSSIPGPEGPIVLRIMVRSSQSTRASGRQVFKNLRSDTVGAVQFLRDGDTIDSTGNLETIPPYTHEGKSYPAGRIIMGTQSDKEPLIMPLLRAQETQNPVILDTSWLYVGHVDEFVHFLPADNERGWVMMICDPLAAIGILQKASKDGHGGKRAISRPEFDYDMGLCVPDLTIDEQLAKPDLVALNEKAAKSIEGNVDILKHETGITDDEIFHVPAVFYYVSDADGSCGDNNSSSRSSQELAPRFLDQTEAIGLPRLERRQQSGKRLVADVPDAINGVVLSDSYYLAPNPWGPLIDGKDIMAEAITAAYAKVNYTVHYMDDWYSLHLSSSEIHCGSNTWRNADDIWW